MAQSLERGEIVFASFRNIIVALAILNACALFYMKTSDKDYFKVEDVVITNNQPITNKYYDPSNGNYYFVVDNKEHNVQRKVYNEYKVGSNVSLTVRGDANELHELMFLFLMFSAIGLCVWLLCVII